MAQHFSRRVELLSSPLAQRSRTVRHLSSLDLVITARCNNDCGHCYNRLPAQDEAARDQEMPTTLALRLIDEAAAMGALWCLITGGEPLLRKDFVEIYLHAKRRGLLVTVFTNATALAATHVALFRDYPPRNIEVTVYGVTKETYESVTRTPGSFERFMQGLELLWSLGIPVQLKATIMRSNVHEFAQIMAFGKKHTQGVFRFDPFLNLRCDRDPVRNALIQRERLTGEEIVALEKADGSRYDYLCREQEREEAMPQGGSGDMLFRCGAGWQHGSVDHRGFFVPCLYMADERCSFDLRQASLASAWNEWLPQVLSMRAQDRGFLASCGSCTLCRLCMWCPAHAYGETGSLEGHSDYFCAVARARAAAIQEKE